MTTQTVQQLLDKGVTIHCPSSVHIGDEVDVRRIDADGVVIHAGCRILGPNTYIAAGADIGAEAPVTIDDCVLGPGVSLRGGYFKESVFLEGASMGSGAHVRSGTILEEYASGAHTVGLKQTILFPYVTLGSLINFCDILMAGGTSRQNHSEVGSSYIHFNYSPNQDKATASLVGDVARGVMLDSPPIFLGGQGGLVGPCAIAYGTVIAAGTIQRKDQDEPGRLVVGGAGRGGSLPFQQGKYGHIKRIFHRNLRFIGHLAALDQWYRHVRSRFLSPPVHAGLVTGVGRGYVERRLQLSRFIENVKHSQEHYGAASASLERQQQALIDHRASLLDLIDGYFGGEREPNLRDAFLKLLDAAMAHRTDAGYLDLIGALETPVKDAGIRWLSAVADGLLTAVCERIPEVA